LENLEEQLNSAKPEQPTAIKDESPQPEEDNELKFEIKKVEALKSEEPETKKAPQSISPVESTIEESMRLRGEERRTKLKAFNYRFKNNPNSVDEAESVPAFKRQGLKIEDENYSKDGKISRFTIDDGESGTDIKTNNSFLHDNVD
jgi:cell division protein FtsZ